MSGAKTVRVVTFGAAVEVLGWAERDCPLPVGGTVDALIEQLAADCPRLGEARERLRYAVNQRYASRETPLQAGDEVALIPPVSGGALPAARLVRTPIELTELVSEVEHAGVGAIATFLGVVRYEADVAGRALRGLEYSAYESMALGEMSRLCAQAAEEYPIHKAVAVHRLGWLMLGEASIAVVVSAAHRAAAFEACRFLVEGVKRDVPIYKREHWQDGQSTWVNPP